MWSFCLGSYSEEEKGEEEKWEEEKGEGNKLVIYDEGDFFLSFAMAILLFIGAWGLLWRETKPGLMLKLREHEEKTPEWQREEKREELKRQQVQAQRIDFTRRGRYMAWSLGWMALAFPLLIAGGLLVSRDSYDPNDGAGLMLIFGGLLAMLSLAMLEGAGCRFRTGAPDNPCNDPCCKFTPARLLAYALYMASFALWVILCMVGIEEMDVGVDVGAVAAAFPVIIILIWGVLWCDVERSRRAGFTRTRDNKPATSTVSRVDVQATMTWERFDEEAKEQGGRLPTATELQAALTAQNVPPQPQDSWVPVSRNDGQKNDWVQDSEKHWIYLRFAAHSEKYGFPAWGENSSPASYRPNYFYLLNEAKDAGGTGDASTTSPQLTFAVFSSNSSIGSAPSDRAAVVPIGPTTRAESKESEANDGAGAAGAASAHLVAPVAVLAGV
jgi:hypothetical protein